MKKETMKMNELQVGTFWERGFNETDFQFCSESTENLKSMPFYLMMQHVKTLYEIESLTDNWVNLICHKNPYSCLKLRKISLPEKEFVKRFRHVWGPDSSDLKIDINGEFTMLKLTDFQQKIIADLQARMREGLGLFLSNDKILIQYCFSTNIRESINDSNGSYCQKCNVFNEYVSDSNYICYSCRTL